MTAGDREARTRREFLRDTAVATASAAAAAVLGERLSGAAGEAAGRTVAIFRAGVRG